MIKQLTALVVLLCLVSTDCAARFTKAQTPTAPAPPLKEKDIAKLKKRALDAGANAKVVVRLRDGEKLKGRILEITDEAMILQVLKKQKVESRRLEFQSISEIHNQELSPGAKIAIGAGVGAAVTFIVLGILIASLDN